MPPTRVMSVSPVGSASGQADIGRSPLCSEIVSFGLTSVKPHTGAALVLCGSGGPQRGANEHGITGRLRCIRGLWNVKNYSARFSAMPW